MATTNLFSCFAATKDNGVLTIDSDSLVVGTRGEVHVVLNTVKQITPTLSQENSEWLRLLEIDAECCQGNIIFEVYGAVESMLFRGIATSNVERFYYVGRTAEGVHYAVSDFNLDEVVEVRGDDELMALLDSACLVEITNFLMVPMRYADETKYMHFPVMDDADELLSIEGLMEISDESYSTYATEHRGERYSTLCLDGDKTVILPTLEPLQTKWYL